MSPVPANSKSTIFTLPLVAREWHGDQEVLGPDVTVNEAGRLPFVAQLVEVVRQAFLLLNDFDELQRPRLTLRYEARVG